MTTQEAIADPQSAERPASTAADTAPRSSSAGRVAAIDALRGFDMFWIIGGASVFAALAEVWPNSMTLGLQRQFEHVRWEGCHVYDLIFPLFLFLIGAVLPFSLKRRQGQGEHLGRVYLHFLKRSLVLIVLGAIPSRVLSFKWPAFGGVLAHIGLCYLPAAILVRHTGWRTRGVVVGTWLVGYWLACLLIPVPDYGAGVFTQQGSLPSWIDHHVMPGRLENEGPCSVPAGVVLILCGSLAGEWLRSDRSGGRKAAGLAAAGLGAVVLGWVWSLSFPMIKKVIWSSSYVTFALGWSLLLLALFYWLIDVKGYRRWAFFWTVIGTNAITIYFLQTIVNFRDIARCLLVGLDHSSGAWGPLVLALGVVATKWLVLWYLYRHKIFLKL